MFEVEVGVSVTLWRAHECFYFCSHDRVLLVFYFIFHYSTCTMLEAGWVSREWEVVFRYLLRNANCLKGIVQDRAYVRKYVTHSVLQ